MAWSTPGSCCEIAAIDVERDRLAWHASITHRSTVPVIHRGRLIVGTSGHRTGSARVTAYDVATGAVQWRTQVPGRFGTRLWGDAAGDDVVFANDAGSVVSLDVSRGTLRWASEAVEPSGEAHPKLAGDRVFLTPRNVGAVEIDRRTGAVIQSGRFEPDVYVHSSAGLADQFEVLVGNGIESAIWAFGPADAAPESS
jgi:outer membrane protein assembly factor BamB